MHPEKESPHSGDSLPIALNPWPPHHAAMARIGPVLSTPSGNVKMVRRHRYSSGKGNVA